MKLEVIADGLKLATILGVFAGSLVINETIQQTKHLYYHITGKKHKRINLEDLNPGTRYDHISVYIPKIN